MMPTELGSLDATAQAELVRRREISPRELVEAAIARLEAVNPQLNAVIHTQLDEARARANDAALPDGLVLDWFKKGWTALIDRHLVSQTNWQRLVDLETQALRVS